MIRTPALVALLCLAAAVPASGVDIPVSPGGSISTALAGANAGDRVLVQAGSYAEQVTLKDGVHLRGGYDGSFSEGSRDPLSNVTTITGSGAGPAITSGPSVTSATEVNGFVLTGGGGSPGAGVLVTGGAPIFANNEISGNLSAGAAGGVYVRTGSTARFVNNRIENNSSEGSGGGMRVENSPATLVNNTFEDNTAPHSGGGLYVFNSAIACTANTFRSNLAGEGGGGGVYFQACIDAVLAENTFDDNQAPYGGGVFARDESEVTFDENTFLDCDATVSGGGVASMTFCELVFVDNHFEGCTAQVAGGGIWVYQGVVSITGDHTALPNSPAMFVGCTASGPPDPFARGVGGGVSLSSCTATITGVNFSGCTADSVGGGFYAIHSETQIQRNLFESCVAPDGAGLVLHTYFATMHRQSRVHNNTLWGNRGTLPTGDAGAVLFLSHVEGIVRFAGNIVANTLEGGCIRCRGGLPKSFPATVSIECTSVQLAAGNPSEPVAGGDFDPCVQAFTSSGVNRVEDPKFCGAPADYRLQNCSPAVDSGCLEAGTEGMNRGALPDGTDCACGLVAVEADSWGKIKARYR